MRTKILCLSLFSIGLTGCVSQPKQLYNWGSYQTQLYTMYSKPEKASAQQQVIAIEKDIQKSKATNQAVPPGVYAHLAYQYSLTGDLQNAKKYMELEKQVYPESTVYIDRLLQRMN